MTPRWPHFLPSMLSILLLAMASGWACYFGLLLLIDHQFGPRQFQYDWLLGSPGVLLREALAVIRAGSWFVVPMLLLWGTVVALLDTPRSRLLAIATGASLLEALLLWQGFSPLNTLAPVAAFVTAMMVTWAATAWLESRSPSRREP